MISFADWHCLATGLICMTRFVVYFGNHHSHSHLAMVRFTRVSTENTVRRSEFLIRSIGFAGAAGMPRVTTKHTPICGFGVLLLRQCEAPDTAPGHESSYETRRATLSALRSDWFAKRACAGIEDFVGIFVNSTFLGQLHLASTHIDPKAKKSRTFPRSSGRLPAEC